MGTENPNKERIMIATIALCWIASSIIAAAVICRAIHLDKLVTGEIYE